MKSAKRTLVIGVGNPWRGDDGLGPAVARRLREKNLPDVEVREASGEGVALIEAWKNFDAVVVIDAVDSGAAPGTIYRIDAHEASVAGSFFHYSTHAFSVAEAVELARTLDQLPPRLVLFGIEGGDFSAGAALSPKVVAVMDEMIGRVKAEVERSFTSPESSAMPETKNARSFANDAKRSPEIIASCKKP